MAAFKRTLRMWRGKRGQKEVADLLMVPIKTYQNWEQGINPPSRFRLNDLQRSMQAHQENGQKSA